jgi:hypothetical protein
VKREYYKLAGRPTLLKGCVYDREPLRDGGTVTSGERVETVLTIEAKNNYEYLLFEDLKAAGFEAVEIRSGENLYMRELKSGAVTEKSEIRNPKLITPVARAGYIRNCATGRWRCSLTICRRASGKSAATSARRPPANSTPCPCSAGRCMCRKSAATAPNSASTSWTRRLE